MSSDASAPEQVCAGKYRRVRRVRAFEAGGGVGGTWYWNRYQGVAATSKAWSTRIPSRTSCSRNGIGPSATARNLRSCDINHVVDRFDLRRDIEFNTRVQEAVFDSKTNTWTIRTDKGNAATARFCITATGNLSTPRTPSLPGLESFKGEGEETDGFAPHRRLSRRRPSRARNRGVPG
jgi:cyclohexanone monooxygenase